VKNTNYVAPRFIYSVFLLLLFLGLKYSHQRSVLKHPQSIINAFWLTKLVKRRRTSR